MPPPSYAKKKNAELDTLLQLRGLATGGTKIEKLSRLVKQDQEDENARKATEASVRAASNMAAETVDTNAAVQQDQGALKRNRRRFRGNGTMGRKTTVKRQATESGGRLGLNEQDREAEDRDRYVKSLMAGRANATCSDIGQTKRTEHRNTLPGIVVSMTPKGVREHASISTSTASRLRRLKKKGGGVQLEKDGSRTVFTHETAEEEGIGGWVDVRVAVGAVAVFICILGAVLVVEMVVKWYVGMGRARSDGLDRIDIGERE
jgi:hypothetical protein